MTTTELPTTGGAAEATTGGTRRTPSTVKVERVTRWYGDVIALNDVTLEVGPGVSGLLGPNGAGKTTLIRLITGMASPGDGQVLLDGEPIRNRLSALERIGYVADGDALYDELTARRFLVDQAAARAVDQPRGRLHQRDALGREQVVDGESVPAHQPPEPAPEGEARDARVADDPAGRGESEGLGLAIHFPP